MCFGNNEIYIKEQIAGAKKDHATQKISRIFCLGQGFDP
jgi:hypothetical protein